MDDRLSKLERNWRMSATKESELLFYRECLRLEILDIKDFKLAAICGHETSKDIMELHGTPLEWPEVVEPTQLPSSLLEFYEHLEQFGRVICLKVLLELLRNCEVFWLAYFPNDPRFSAGFKKLKSLNEVKKFSLLEQELASFYKEQCLFVERQESVESQSDEHVIAILALKMLLHFIFILSIPEKDFFMQRMTARFFTEFWHICELTQGLEEGMKKNIQSFLIKLALRQ